MSKQRAVRRARRRAVLRRLRPALPRRRRSGRLPSGLSRAERAALTVGALVAVTFVWLLVDGLSTRIALTALIALCVPMLFVLTLDRRT